ncbi:MAG: putative lipid II flippase FtsW [Blastocatellia bacterium]
MSEESESRGFFESLLDVRFDGWLTFTVIALSIFGLVMVYSASGYLAAERFRSSSYFMVRQAAWLGIGLIVMFILTKVDYELYWRAELVYGLMIITILLLIGVFFFPPRNGAQRWLSLGGMLSVQPAELAKIVLILFLARFLTLKLQDEEIGYFWLTVAPAAAMTGVLAIMVLRQPDLGTTIMLGVILVVMLFSVGAKFRHLLMFLPLAAIGAYFYIFRVGWRMDRITAFFDPEADPRGKGFQILQALIAIGSGGWSGLGLGGGRQKLLYLPEPHSDFIFAVIGEELGFIGTVAVVLAFGFILWRGFLISRRAPDYFGQLLALGLTVMLVTQAFFNMSVVVSLLPNKGIPMPFVSAGGSSLLFALAAVGILLNISRYGRRKYE